MELESKRLRLVPIAPGDFLALIEGAESFRATFGHPAADELRNFIVSDEVSPEFLEMLRKSTAPDPWKFGFGLVEKASGAVIGLAGFKGPPDDDGTVEIGYGIVPSHERNGFATEATAEVVSFAYQDERVRSIRAHTLPEPNASTRVLEKNGFEFVGTVEDPDDGTVWRWEQRKHEG